MTAVFYKFKKRTNSTERPDESAILHTLNVTLKDGCSIINPTLEIREAATFGNAVSVNYCYIAKFNRYYYVTNIHYERGIWYVSLNVDVLASYRDEIGADNRYILRSSAEHDGTIVDMMYPTKVKSTYAMDSKTIWKKDISDGLFVVTTLSVTGEGVGAAKIWGFTATQFNRFLEVLFGDSGIDLGTIVVSSSIINKLVNPGNYITRCVWYPFSIEDISQKTLQENLFVGDSGIPDVPCYALNSKLWDWTGSVSLSGNMHPKSSRGVYMNRAPFTKYTLFVPPFGVVPFDLVGSEYAFASITISVDLFTGAAILDVLDGDGVPRVLTASVGVDVPLAQINSEVLEKTGTLATQIGTAVGSALTGNVAGTISGGLGAIGTAWSAWENITAIGSIGGNLNSYRKKAYIHALYMDVVDENVNNCGRPLCAKRTISGIPGYIQCGDGYTRISGTAEEYDQVNRIMKEGFYYD